MRWQGFLATIFSLLLLAASSAAKDLCFEDTFGSKFVVQKVKQLKKAGKTSPIKGYAILVGNGDLVSISGTAVARSDGEVYYGVTIHNLLEGKDQSVAGSWDPDTGIITTHYDTDGDGTVNTSDWWSPIDCGSVVIP